VFRNMVIVCGEELLAPRIAYFGIVTIIWAGLQRYIGSIPSRRRFFLFSKMSSMCLGVTKPPIQWKPRYLPSELQRPEREGDHTHPHLAPSLIIT
jgi:hypothetical protein